MKRDFCMRIDISRGSNFIYFFHVGVIWWVGRKNDFQQLDCRILQTQLFTNKRTEDEIDLKYVVRKEMITQFRGCVQVSLGMLKVYFKVINKHILTRS